MSIITPVKKKLKTQPIATILKQKKRQTHHDYRLFEKTSFHLKNKSNSEFKITPFKQQSTIINESIKRKITSPSRTLRQGFPVIPYAINHQRSHNKNQLQIPQFDHYQLLLQQTKILVTAKKWAIYDYNTTKIIKGFKIKKQHQIASLSKLMTFYCAYLVITRYYLVIQKMQFLVTSASEQLKGTKCNIQKEELITIQDLLYGMMLNSGNDAAHTIAINMGLLIHKKNKGQYFSPFDLKDAKEDYTKIFVRLMNSAAKQLNLTETSFYNSHGMSENISSVKDLFCLTQECLKIPIFQKICSTKRYSAKCKFINTLGNVQYRVLNFINTNKLLSNPKYKGIKTGFNQDAGGCLISFYQQEDISLIIIVLGCSGKNSKFDDTQKIVEWYLKGHKRNQLMQK